MALLDKNIIITPNNGSSTDDPKIAFVAGNAATSSTILLRAYTGTNGTLSFEGSAGQLFSISNNFTGTIFSVNDISGIPSIQVSDTGTVTLAGPGNGFVYVASNTSATNTTTGALQVVGGVGIQGDLYARNIYANGTLLTSGGGGGGGASVTIADTRPLTPSAGALWWDSTIGQMFIYYSDPDSNEWVPANPGIQGPAGATGPQGPAGAAGPSGVNTNTTATTFYVQGITPSVSTQTGALVVTGGVGIGNNLWMSGNLNVLSNVNSVSTGTGALIVPYGGAGINGNVYVGVLYSNGAIFAIGSVYANYSDIRLKDIAGAIEDPITKICSIETFYFTPNKLALSLGVTETHRQVGVSAQSVQAVMPEAVAPSPISKDYLTVQYDRLVPLLIESIKQHEAEIQNLREQVRTLAAKIDK